MWRKSIVIAGFAVAYCIFTPTALAQKRNGGIAGNVAKDTSRIITYDRLYGLGYANVLDTYLSPLEYTGLDFSLTRRTQRLTRRSKGRISRMTLFSAHLTKLQSPRDNRNEWDADALASLGWHFNWQPARGWRLALGGLGEVGGGFTYNTKGGNNPAQGRLFADAALSAVAEYTLQIGKSPLTIGTQADIPLIGAAFTPHYGQSYYEIFSLSHTDRNVRLTHPFNSPSMRWLTTVRFPLFGATLTAGYLADIRQSCMAGLKRHSWRHHLVIGYVRKVHLLK